MARKSTVAGEVDDAGGAELRAVRVELKPAIHKQLRLEAAKQDRSMASLVRVVIEDYLSKRKPERRA